MGSINKLWKITLAIAGVFIASVGPVYSATCELTEKGLHLGEGVECSLPENLANRPLKLPELRMEDGSKLHLPALPETESSETTWSITAEEGYFGHDVEIVARGTSGEAGGQGVRGGNGGVCYRNDSRGGTGSNGGTGMPGKRGQNLVLEIGFKSLGSLTIDTTGGEGGRGGRGGEGGQGGRGNVNVTMIVGCHGDRGGNGGRGGKGGQGGDGGYIELGLDMSHGGEVTPILEKVDTKREGGPGGVGGKGGVGGVRGNNHCRTAWPLTTCSRHGTPGSLGIRGPKGVDGKAGDLRVVVSKPFIGMFNERESEKLSPKEVMHSCAGVFSKYPRFQSMSSGYLIDSHVHRYILSNLEMAEVASRQMDQVDPRVIEEYYWIIGKEIEQIDRLVMQKYQEQLKEEGRGGAVRNQIDTLVSIVENADKNGCLNQDEFSRFSQCRAACLSMSSKWNVSAGGGNTNQKGVQGERANFAYGTSSSISVPGACIPGCMRELLRDETFASCGELIDDVTRMRQYLAEIHGHMDSLTLGDAIENKLNSNGGFGWAGPVAVQLPNMFVSICPPRDYIFGVDRCESVTGADRWRSYYTCHGQVYSENDRVEEMMRKIQGE